jgi:homoserine kinase
MSELLTFYAPASSGNLSVGFDALGLALSPTSGALLGDRVTLELLSAPPAHPAPQVPFLLEVSGEFAHKLPADLTRNVIYRASVLFVQALKARGLTPRPLALTLLKSLPVGSGLGSSGCSAVASLVALNHAHDNPLSSNELLRLMGALEGELSGGVHYDNVAPSYLGGLQLMSSEGEGDEAPLCVRLPSFDAWRWVLCYPGVSLSTAEARAVMPSHYPLRDCLSYGRRLATFVHASHEGLEDLAASRLHDVLAEPYRAPLIKGLAELKERVKELGGLAAGISGAGPTLFAVARGDEQAATLEAWMREHLEQGPEAFTLICEIDHQGARLL